MDTTAQRLAPFNHRMMSHKESRLDSGFKACLTLTLISTICFLEPQIFRKLIHYGHQTSFPQPLPKNGGLREKQDGRPCAERWL